MSLYLGIDFGTSGARSLVIDENGAIQAEGCYNFYSPSQAQDWIGMWESALFGLIAQIPVDLRQEIQAIAIDGTSGTVLLCDQTGKPIAAPILYNDGRGESLIENLRKIAPPNHIVLSATSSLVKLLWLIENYRSISENCYFLHQADWLAFLLHGKIGISDYHNALKLGYDPETLSYPNWIYEIKCLPHLPEIVKPGTIIGEISSKIAKEFGIRKNCVVCAGTTDSIAAFLASGAEVPGEAVTSLGSTLVLKLLSRDRVDDSRYGIYSHRLGDLWLTGGASNTGGIVLRQFFTDAEIENLSIKIDPDQQSYLEYYPLIKPGDRFPINDPKLPPRLEPRPADPVEFLHGLLESIARIEAQGYHLLQELGATRLIRVYTAGGGAKNSVWTAIRRRYLQVSVFKSTQTAAAYGMALLAYRNFRKGVDEESKK